MRAIEAPIAPAPRSDASARRRRAARAMPRVRAMPAPAVVHDATSTGAGKLDDSVRQRGKRGTVGHDHRGAAGRPGGARRPARPPPSRRRGSRWARRGGAAVRPARRHGPGTPAGARRPRAPPLPRPSRVSAPCGSRRTTSVSPAASSAAATAASEASGRPSRTFSATERAKRWGRWGTQPMRRRQSSRSRSARSTPPRDTEPASGTRKSRTTERRVDLPHPLGPVTATVSPGATTSSAPSSAGTRRPG